MAIEQIGTIASAAGGAATDAGAAAGEAAPGFASSLERLVSSVESSGAAANSAVADMMSGKGEVHDAMIALQRAEITLQLTMQVRNKLVQAYTEIMRMPV